VFYAYTPYLSLPQPSFGQQVCLGWRGVGRMLSKADDCEALERLERASRTRDADAQRILLQDVVRQWWRMTELKKIFGSDKR
jgi:hypothetical protein